MTPKVDTFEHDIANEIRRKEATLAEIQAVSQKEGGTSSLPLPQKKLPILTIVLVILFVISLIGIGGIAYYYFSDPLLPPSAQSVDIKASDVPKNITSLTVLSPELASGIGRFVTTVEKKDAGYILSISSYSDVFAYMARNETVYIPELATVFGVVTISTTTPEIPKIPATTTPIQSTPISTSTQKVSTSTKQGTQASTPKATKVATTSKTTATTTPIEEEIFDLRGTTGTQLSESNASFNDITVANQNMRVYTKDGHSVVYAFVGSTHLLIAKSPEDILLLRSAILH